MKVNVTTPNPAMISIFRHPDQIITLDANFFIPPNRSSVSKRGFDFPLFESAWLTPIFQAFPRLAIHEAVYSELVMPVVRAFADSKLNSECEPPDLILHIDSSLSEHERVLRDYVESKIYKLTKYDPALDNKDDRGEVKSLSYIAVKGLLFFAAHDYNAIQLIEKAEQWSTGLDNIQAIKMYELIFYLHKAGFGDKKHLRMLYKYQYHLTDSEKRQNPTWGDFIEEMNTLYAGISN